MSKMLIFKEIALGPFANEKFHDVIAKGGHSMIFYTTKEMK